VTDQASGTEADKPVAYTHIGGQALLEGVMMRGKINWAVAVRTPDGRIHVEEHDLPGGVKTGWRTWPLGRGMWALYETLSLAMKAFTISARFLEVEGDDDKAPEAQAEASAIPSEASEAPADPAEVPIDSPPTENAAAAEHDVGRSEPEVILEPPVPSGLTPGEIGLTMVLGILLAVGVFIVLPAFATSLFVKPLEHPFIWNVLDGVLRLVVFFAYIWGVGRIPDIRRVFAYHGAEHKTIHAYEHGLPLEPAYIQRYGTLHVRCGTSFLLMVMVIAILVFSLVPGKAILAAWGVTNAYAVILFNICVRIVLLPLVAGLAYEVTVKWAGTRPDDPLVRILLWPGMQLQRMTTREPDDTMVEVAVAALKAVADREQRESADSADRGAPELAT
jgi:uncharacterized protein YqhQ